MILQLHGVSGKVCCGKSAAVCRGILFSLPFGPGVLSAHRTDRSAVFLSGQTEKASVDPAGVFIACGKRFFIHQFDQGFRFFRIIDLNKCMFRRNDSQNVILDPFQHACFMKHFLNSPVSIYIDRCCNIPAELVFFFLFIPGIRHRFILEVQHKNNRSSDQQNDSSRDQQPVFLQELFHVIYDTSFESFIRNS